MNRDEQGEREGEGEGERERERDETWAMFNFGNHSLHRGYKLRPRAAACCCALSRKSAIDVDLEVNRSAANRASG